MLLEALRTARDLGRLHEVASVLVRHGLGDMVRRLGIARVLRQAGRAVHWKAAERIGTKTTPQHVREALEELGPTFVKAGQLLADRTDLLPPAWTDELAQLRQRAAPAPWAEIRPGLVEDLGGEPESVFAEFDPEPLAAASIAQVYRAVLRSGEPVAVKVCRPGIRDVVQADLRLLARLAEAAERELPELRRYRPVHVARQLAASLRAEMDLRTEARNAERLRETLAGHRELVIPRIHQAYTRPGLCVMELLDGESLTDWLRSGRAGQAQRRHVAKIGAEAVLEMVLGKGFFHADPHPGNLYLLRDGRVGLLDFGMVGRLTESRSAQVFELILAALDGSEDRIVDVLLDWSQDGGTEVDLLTQDCAYFIDRYRDLSLGQLDLAAMLSDVAALVRENNLSMPTDVTMLLKVFITLERLGRQLDPEFATAAHVEPFVRRAARAHRSPLRLLRRELKDGRALLLALPRHGRRLLRQLRQGRVGLDIRVRHLDELGQRLDRAASRLTIGLVTAALIVGTSIAMTIPAGPAIHGVPAFALFGFVSSLLAGLWILWQVLRAGR